MEASRFEPLGDRPFDPQPLFNPLVMRRIRVGNRTGIRVWNRAISPRRLQPVIGRVFRFAEDYEPYSYFVDQRHVGKVAVSGD